MPGLGRFRDQEATAEPEVRVYIVRSRHVGWLRLATNDNFSSNGAANGGAIHNRYLPTLTGQVTRNSAQYEGGIYKYDLLTLGTSSAPAYVQYNQASIDGGGIENGGTLTGPSVGLVLFNTLNNISSAACSLVMP